MIGENGFDGSIRGGVISPTGKWQKRIWVLFFGLFGLTFLFGLFFVFSDDRKATHKVELFQTEVSEQYPATFGAAIVDDEGKPLRSGRVRVYAWTEETAEASDASLRDWYLVTSGTVNQGRSLLEIPALEEWGRPVTGLTQIPVRVELRPQVFGKKEYFTAFLRVAQAQDSSGLALTLDRPLYQPGQTMQMRVVAVDGMGVPQEKVSVTWQIHDPQGNLVYESKEETSPAGVSAIDFQLSSRGIQGTYKVSVSSGNGVQSQEVEVRPFRLPRFTVDLQTQAERIDRGEPLLWELSAQYIHGEPVAGAQATLFFEWEEFSGVQTESREVTLDDQGRMEIAWNTTTAKRPGTMATIRAEVRTDAGRMEETSSSLVVDTMGPRIAIYPAGRPNFVSRVENRGIVVARDAQGRPLRGQTVELSHRDSQLGSVELDEKGRGEFSWVPENAGSYQIHTSIEAIPMSTQSFDVPVVGLHEAGYLLSAPALGRVGEELVVHVRAHDEDLLLTLEKSGMVVAQRVLPPRSEPYETTITPGVGAQGSTTLQVGTLRGSSAGVKIWVRQASTTLVEVTPGSEQYEPQDQAEVNLFFPAQTDSGLSQVFFGLVGVDEALYALAERAEIPFPLLLQQAPEVVVNRLPLLDGFDDEDKLGQEMLSAQFFRGEAVRSSLPSTSLRDRTEAQQRENLASKASILSVIALFLLYLLLVIAFWTTFRAARVESYWRKGLPRLGMIFFKAVFLPLFVILMLVVFFEEGALFLGLLWIPLVLIYLIYTSSNSSTEEGPKSGALGEYKWLGQILAAMAMIFTVHKALEWAGEFPVEILEKNETLLLWILPALGALIMVFAWSSIMLGAKRGYGILLGGAVLGSLWFIVFFGAFFGETIRGFFVDAQPEVATINLGSGRGMMSTASGGGGGGGGGWGGGGGRSSASSTAPRRNRTREASRGAARANVAEEEVELLAQGAARSAEPASEAGNANEDASIRSLFPETMVWLPEIHGDAEGNAKVSFLVPDSMTTWRLTAFAHSTDGRFGQGEAAMRVTRELFVEMELPPELIDGDRLEIPVTLINHGQETREITLHVEAEGALVAQSLSATSFAVGPNQREVFTVDLLARGVGYGTLVVEARDEAGTRVDGERRHARVAPHGRRITENRSGLIGTGIRESFEVPTGVVPGTTHLDVNLLTGMNAELVEGLEGMLRKPNGCFEQTSSINFPNVLLLQLLETTSPGDWPGGEEVWQEAHRQAREYIDLGYQRILTFEHSRGGFALYPNRQAEVLLTAYGLLQLGHMKELTTVNQAMLERNQRWLISKQNPDGSWAPDSRRTYGQSRLILESQATAIAIQGLMMSGYNQNSAPILRGLNALVERSKELRDPYPISLVANALIMGGREGEARTLLTSLYEQIEAQGRLNSNTPTWMGGRRDQPRIEATAMTIVAAQRLSFRPVETARLLEDLMTARSYWGGWGSTQSTVWALKALSGTVGSTSRAEARVRFEGEDLLQVSSREADRRHRGVVRIEEGAGRVYSLLGEDIQGSGTLGIDVTDDIGARYQAVLEYALPWTAPGTENDGELLLRLVHQGNPEALVVQQRTEVVAQIENRSSRRYDTLIVELPVAPGAFVSRDFLEDAFEAGKIDYFEILPTHIRLYLLAIEPGETFEFPYSFVPLLRGEATLPPLRTYEFYTPQPFFEIDGAAIIVE